MASKLWTGFTLHDFGELEAFSRSLCIRVNPLDPALQTGLCSHTSLWILPPPLSSPLGSFLLHSSRICCSKGGNERERGAEVIATSRLVPGKSVYTAHLYSSFSSLVSKARHAIGLGRGLGLNSHGPRQCSEKRHIWGLKGLEHVGGGVEGEVSGGRGGGRGDSGGGEGIKEALEPEGSGKGELRGRVGGGGGGGRGERKGKGGGRKAGGCVSEDWLTAPSLQSSLPSSLSITSWSMASPPCEAEGGVATVEQLGSERGLEEWLKEHLEEGAEKVQQWGCTHGTKRVANLWKELVEGEIVLEGGIPPKRIVRVVSVIVRREGDGKVLLESHQEMGDGKVRGRMRPLSEKMRPGESVEEACLRGIREELGEAFAGEGCVRVLSPSPFLERLSVEERDSFSYPGLRSKYFVYSIDVEIRGLPEGSFCTVENEFGGGLEKCVDEGNERAVVGVKTHFWVWADAEKETL